MMERQRQRFFSQVKLFMQQSKIFKLCPLILFTNLFITFKTKYDEIKESDFGSVKDTASSLVW